MSARIVVGMGANVGSCRAAFRVAAASLPGVVEALSPVYATEPVGPAQPRYANAALRLRTEQEPRALLASLLELESALGRDRAHEQRWGPRTLDLDILFWEGRHVDEPDLRIPHARLEDRAFALAPLLDVVGSAAPGEDVQALEQRLRDLGGPPSRAPAIRVETSWGQSRVRVQADAPRGEDALAFALAGPCPRWRHDGEKAALFDDPVEAAAGPLHVDAEGRWRSLGAVDERFGLVGYELIAGPRGARATADFMLNVSRPST